MKGLIRRRLAPFALVFAMMGLAGASSALAQSESALVVLSVPPHPAVSRDYFRRVDLNTGQFIGRPVLYEVQTIASLDFTVPRNQINADHRDRPVALARRVMPPGDYVWLSSFRTIGNWARGAQREICHFEGAPVFRVSPGSTTIIRVDRLAFHEVSSSMVELRTDTAVTDDQVLEEFQLARTQRPELSVEAQIAVPVAFISWDAQGSRPDTIDG